MKKLLLFGAIALSLNSFGQVPSYVPTNGLEVYYQFNGNANEEINALNGVVNGAVLSSDYNGDPSKAYLFNGTSDYIAIPSEFFSGSDNVPSSSYRVRFMCNAIGVEQQGIWNKDGSWREMRIRVHPDSSLSLTWAYPSYYDGVQTIAGKINPGVWYDVVFIIANNEGRIYIDGIEETSYAATVSNSSVSFANTGQTCVSGGIECNRFGLIRWAGAPSRYLNGKLDEFGIWDRPLTECEIQDLYYSGINAFTDVTQNGATLTADLSGATYQWLDCDNGNQFIVGATSQAYTPIATGNYAVQVNASGCIDTSACYLVDYTGLKEMKNNTINVFPNPTTESFNIEVKQNLVGSNYSIFDQLGKVVQNGVISNTSQILNAAKFSKGIYNLTIEATDVHVKLVKE